MDVIELLNRLAADRIERDLHARLGLTLIYACDDAEILAPAITVTP